MQGSEVFLEFFGCEVSTREPFLGAAFERGGKSLAGETPAGGGRLLVEPVEFAGGRRQRLGSAGGGSGFAGLRAVSRVFLHGVLGYLQYRRPSNAAGILGILGA